MFSIMQTEYWLRISGHIKTYLSRQAANWYERWKNKTEQKKYKSQCKIKYGLCLARACRKMDAPMKFAEHEKSELLEVKPRASFSSVF